MATNTGIEVTALRPAASAGDFYVRPEAYDPSVANGLARLSGNMNKKQKIEDKATAENLHISDSLNNAKDIHDFSAYAHQSAGVVAHLKELRGVTLGHAWRTETEQAVNEWRVNSSETGEDFPSFMAERKAALAEKLGGDRFMTAGALGIIKETEYALNAQHRAFLDTRMREDTKTNMTNAMDVFASNIGNGLSVLDAAAQVEEMVMTSNATGAVDKAVGNEMMFNHAIQMFKTTGNPNYRLLARNLRWATGGGEVVNSKAMAVLKQATDYVAQEQAQKEKDIAYQAKASIDAAISKDLLSLNNFFQQHPYKSVDPEIQASLIANGFKQSDINLVRGAYQKEFEVPQRLTPQQLNNANSIFEQIDANGFNPAGSPISIAFINKEVIKGRLHPSQAQGLMTRLTSASKNKPLIDSAIFRQFQEQQVNQILNKSSYKSRATAAEATRLHNVLEQEMNVLLNNHYSIKGAETPTSNEMMSYTRDALAATKEERTVIANKVATDQEYMDQLSDAALSSKEKEKKLFFFTDSRVPFTGSDTEDVEEFFATTPRGSELEALIKEDPLQMYPLNGEELPVWQVLEKSMIASGYGAGAFHSWYEDNKSIWTDE